MTLLETVRDLGSLDGGDTIYAEEPWTAGSQVIIAREADAGGQPVEAQKLGLKYFLEVFLAREFLEGWTENLDIEPTAPEMTARLIQYALTDA